jgi:acyl dehydratase
MKQGAYLGIDRWRFIAPVKIGDSVGAKVKILEKKVFEKKPEWGVIRFGMTITNQNGKVVQAGEHVVAINRRDRD